MGVHRFTCYGFDLFYCYDDGKPHGIRYQQITFTIRVNTKRTSSAFAGNEHRVSPVSLCCLDEWIERTAFFQENPPNLIMLHFKK